MNDDIIRADYIKSGVFEGDLISRNYVEKLGATCLARRNENGQLETIISLDNVQTVNPKELQPLIDKVVEVLPELTDAIIKELPKMVNGKIKCSECSYYTNTWEKAGGK